MRFIFTLTAVLSLLPATADDWPQFRGPHANGVAADNAQLPMNWDKTTNVKWNVDVPGWGWACPVVTSGRVYIATVVSDDETTQPRAGLYLGQGVRTASESVHHWVVLCYDLNTGQKLWSQEVHTGAPPVPRHPKSTYASETPCTDGDRVYVLFGDIGLFAFDLDGHRLWEQMFEPRSTFFDYGAAASPVVHAGQIFVVYDNIEKSWIQSFDAKTGDSNWKTDRNEKLSWATPFVWSHEQRTELVVPGRNSNRSYDLQGNLLWQFDGKMSNLVIPSPFAAHGLCYITSGYFQDRHRPVFAIKPGASGDLGKYDQDSAKQHLAWYQGKAGPYNPSPIVYGDYYYTLYDHGFLTCHDAKTGEEIYGKVRLSPSGSFTSSPWAYNGHLFFLNENGLTNVIKAGPEFESVDTCDLDELCLSSPAISDGNLLLRTASKLYCLTTPPPVE
jgi:outer membrane protein assembly factor BamB